MNLSICGYDAVRPIALVRRIPNRVASEYFVQLLDQARLPEADFGNDARQPRAAKGSLRVTNRCLVPETSEPSEFRTASNET